MVRGEDSRDIKPSVLPAVELPAIVASVCALEERYTSLFPTVAKKFPFPDGSHSNPFTEIGYVATCTPPAENTHSWLVGPQETYTNPVLFCIIAFGPDGAVAANVVRCLVEMLVSDTIPEDHSDEKIAL
jgi:hypothetical protein